MNEEYSTEAREVARLREQNEDIKKKRQRQRQKAQRKTEAAQKLMEKAFNSNPLDRQAIAQAMDFYNDAINIDPAAKEPYVALAYISWHFGKKEPAIQLLNTAMKNNPYNYKAEMMLEQIKQDYNQPKQAPRKVVKGAPASAKKPGGNGKKEFPPLEVFLGPPQKGKKGNVNSKGGQVGELKGLLQQLGIKVAMGDTFDPTTYKAVCTFQMKHKLPVTGVVDNNTWKLLNRVVFKVAEKKAKIEKPGGGFEVKKIKQVEQDPNAKEITLELGPAKQKKVSEGPQVKLLQEALRHQGFNKVVVSGKFDQETFSSLRKLQMKNKVPMTGVTESKTREFLNQILLKVHQEKQSQGNLLHLIIPFRESRRLPVSGLWEQILKQRVEALFKLVQDIPKGTETYQPPSKKEVPRPFLKSDISTPGQLGIVSEGIEVLRMREVLHAAGYEVEPSETFDIKSFSALKQFQEERGLTVTGVVDAPTRAIANQLLEKRYEREELVEEVEKTIEDLQTQLKLPRVQAIDLQVKEAIQDLIFGKQVQLTQELGPANRAGKVSQGLEVAILKDFLNKNGFDTEINFTFELATYNLVREFQKQNRLPMSGVVDAKTRDFINESL